MSQQTYDLGERTSLFSERLIVFCQRIPINPINNPLVTQLVRAGTSIGANYCEANGASSKKDFRNKIFICKKEAGETQYWLRLMEKIIHNNQIGELNILQQEIKELVMIFTTIAKNSGI